MERLRTALRVFGAGFQYIYPAALLVLLLLSVFGALERLGVIPPATTWLYTTPVLPPLVGVGGLILCLVLLVGLGRFFAWDRTARWLIEMSLPRGGVWMLDLLILIVAILFGAAEWYFFQLSPFDMVYVVALVTMVALAAITRPERHLVAMPSETWTELIADVTRHEALTRVQMERVNETHYARTRTHANELVFLIQAGDEFFLPDPQHGAEIVIDGGPPIHGAPGDEVQEAAPDDGGTPADGAGDTA